MQAYHWCLAGPVINGHNVEATGTFSHLAFGEEALRSAHHDVLFFPRSALAMPACHLSPCGCELRQSQRLSIIADEVEFALDAPGCVIPRHEHVSIAAQIPVGVGLSFGLSGKVSLFAQTPAGCSAHRLKHQS
jgi:hypothetical protein